MNPYAPPAPEWAEPTTRSHPRALAARLAGAALAARVLTMAATALVPLAARLASSPGAHLAWLLPSVALVAGDLATAAPLLAGRRRRAGRVALAWGVLRLLPLMVGWLLQPGRFAMAVALDASMLTALAPLVVGPPPGRTRTIAGAALAVVAVAPALLRLGR